MPPSKNWNKSRNKNANKGKPRSGSGSSSGGGKGSRSDSTSSTSTNSENLSNMASTSQAGDTGCANGCSHSDKADCVYNPRAQRLPELPEEVRKQRLEFAKRMLAMIESGEFDQQNCLWTKMDYMGSGNIRLLLWLGMHGKIGTLGPFWPEKIPCVEGETKDVISPRRYKILLETQVMPAFRAKMKPADMRTCWFQTADDLAPEVLEYLHGIFGNRIMCGSQYKDMSPM